ncbi:MAG: ABC transporter [Sphingobium sp.]|nr:MAG: ABC transporter [Sphingobium sp.]
MIRSAALGGLLIGFLLAGTLLAGLSFGGGLVNGQADPAAWTGIAGAAMVLLGWLCVTVRPRWRVPLLLCAGLGTFVAILTLCGVAADVVPGARLLWLAGGMVVAPVLAILCARSLSGAGRAVVLVLLAVLALLAGRLPDGMGRGERPAAVRPALGVVTALPLFWREGRREHAPILAALDSAFSVRAVDRIAADSLSGVDHLLIAQPRPLAPAELVALDAWVRGGGKAVILADPLLLWPTGLPPGDRRSPPSTSLLDPLLVHWGLFLAPVQPQDIQPARRFLDGGALLPVAGVSRFTRRGGPCRLGEDGLVALCGIGKGAVRLVADADLLDDRLWLADPARSTALSARAGDTPGLLVRWLADPLDAAPVAPGAPWARSMLAIALGLRAALLVGMAWVILGAVMIGRRERPGGTGKRMGKAGKEDAEGRTQSEH